MDSKKILESLVKIANNQQKIIHKLAQTALPPDSLPTSSADPLAGGHSAPPAAEVPATNLQSNLKHHDTTTAIVSALGPFYSQSLTGLSVDPGKKQVNVSFKPGHATQTNYNHVLKTVQNLQNSNTITGGPYRIAVA